jgi:hypothetical protein
VAPRRSGILRVRAEVAPTDPPSPRGVAPREQTVEVPKQQAGVLEPEVRDSEATLRAKPAHEVSCDLAVTPRASHSGFPYHGAARPIHLHECALGRGAPTWHGGGEPRGLQ